MDQNLSVNLQIYGVIALRMLLFAALFLLGALSACQAADYYVATDGSDTNPGTKEQPWKTIQYAADTLQPGDTVFIRGGTYRECVQPARGGTSEDQRITYKAYPGETPIIKGSERITNWREDGMGVWRAVLPDSFFGDYNPFTNNIDGPFLYLGQQWHAGEVYLDGETFTETFRVPEDDLSHKPHTWMATHRGTSNTIYANFAGVNPNEHIAEINVRECCFLPKVDGLKYITLDGLTFMHAADNWIYNAGFQKGAVNTRMGYGWIMQNCHVADCKTCGISSGLSGVRGIDYSSVGHHIFRNNLIERCGETGFSGSHGYYASVIENNIIQDINTRRLFGGSESAGIKIHYAVDTIIRNNVIRRVYKFSILENGKQVMLAEAPGIWLDWAAQGTRITGNVISETDDWAIKLEADHGPILVDNNVIIDNVVYSDSERMVLAHNLFVNAGITYQETDDRRSEYWTPHSWTRAGSSLIQYTGDRYFNNIYLKPNTLANNPKNPANPPDFKAGYNIFYLGAQQSQWDQNSIVDATFDPKFTKTDLPNGVTISFMVNNAPQAVKCPLITYDFIGKYTAVNQGIEDHDGKPITIDRDLLGNPRNTTNPLAGPFEKLEAGKTNIFTLIAGPEVLEKK